MTPQPLKSNRGLYSFGAASDAGVKRRDKLNQDRVAVLKPRLLFRHPPVLLLADGMGGYEGGSIASRLAVDGFAHAFRLHWKMGIHAAMHAGLDAAHQAVCKHASKSQLLKSMGTTIVTAVLMPDCVIILNIGDSRAYRIRDEEISQLSHDHSMVGDLFRQGKITRDEVLTHPKRNQLSQSISSHRKSLEPFIQTYDLQTGDVILLCSDGLWSVVDETVIANVATAFPSQAAAERLIRLANNDGGPDNVSVVIGRVGAFMERKVLDQE